MPGLNRLYLAGCDGFGVCVGVGGGGDDSKMRQDIVMVLRHSISIKCPLRLYAI